jgi:serine/threonine protein kinase
VAIKAFMKEAAYCGDGQRGIENEIKLMRTINSPHVVKLHAVYETMNSLYLSMEYLEGTTLDIYLRKNKNPSQEERKKIMKALLTALQDLRQMRIVHRDIKPENIIVS